MEPEEVQLTSNSLRRLLFLYHFLHQTDSHLLTRLFVIIDCLWDCIDY
jgi:hypothetical protein